MRPPLSAMEPLKLGDAMPRRGPVSRAAWRVAATVVVLGGTAPGLVAVWSGFDWSGFDWSGFDASGAACLSLALVCSMRTRA